MSVFYCLIAISGGHQFEYVLKNVFGELLATKRARWDEYQKESRERMVELAEYFSGEKVRSCWVCILHSSPRLVFVGWVCSRFLCNLSVSVHERHFASA